MFGTQVALALKQVPSLPGPNLDPDFMDVDTRNLYRKTLNYTRVPVQFGNLCLHFRTSLTCVDSSACLKFCAILAYIGVKMSMLLYSRSSLIQQLPHCGTHKDSHRQVTIPEILYPSRSSSSASVLPNGAQRM